MRCSFWISLVLLCFVLRSTEAETSFKPKKVEQCGIYLAPSTIPGAGMGMFAGHTSYHPGDIVSDSDLTIPVFELDWHNNNNNDLSFLWSEYTWSPSTFKGMEQEVEDIHSLDACSGGFGAAVNCRLNQINLEDADDSKRLSMSGVLSDSPGSGAFTPYYGRQFEATTFIPPGMELFISYGQNYFQTRSAYDKVPLRENYRAANKFLKKFQLARKKIPALTNHGSLLTEALYHFVVHDFPFPSRTIYALPQNVSQIGHVLATGGTANATYNESIRDLDWLEEHGQCADNLQDGISLLPHAGRGAFARRCIPQGGLVAPLPLIHLGDRNILTMYEDLTPHPDDPGTISRNASSPYHKQLLLNYCFGHADTSLLLCPYGLLNMLINHSHKQPNAKIVWSNNKTLRHPEWLNETYKSWYKTKHSGLSFDVVALRDIQQDEEILIDYGIEWETAWQDHVANFDSPRRSGYMPAFEMNNRAVDLQIKTIYEIDYERGDGIFTFCRKTIVEMALGGEKNAALLLANNKKIRVDVEDPEEEECYPCRVVHRNHDNSYIAELFSRETTNHQSGFWKVDVDTVEYVLFDVPRDTFFFHDAPYQRDHHQHWSFRHDMRIPDEILPDAWRDSLEVMHPVEAVDDNNNNNNNNNHSALDSTAERLQYAVKGVDPGSANAKDSGKEEVKARDGSGQSNKGKRSRKNKDHVQAGVARQREREL